MGGERPWWLRPDGLPPRAEKRRQELLARPFPPERARRNTILLACVVAAQVAVALVSTVLFWSRHTRNLVAIWLIFGAFLLFQLLLFFRHRRDIRGMINT